MPLSANKRKSPIKQDAVSSHNKKPQGRMAQHCQQRHKSQLSFCSSTLSVGTGICLAPFTAARWLTLSPQWEELPTKLSYQEGKPFPKLPTDFSMCLMGQNWVTCSCSKQSTKDEIFLIAEDNGWGQSSPSPKHANICGRAEKSRFLQGEKRLENVPVRKAVFSLFTILHLMVTRYTKNKRPPVLKQQHTHIQNCNRKKLQIIQVNILGTK